MLFFIYDGQTLKENDEKRIQDLSNAFNLNFIIYFNQMNASRKYFGKPLSGNVTVNIKENEKEEIQNLKIIIGALESTSSLYEKIETVLYLDKKIKKLYLNNKEINK